MSSNVNFPSAAGSGVANALESVQHPRVRETLQRLFQAGISFTQEEIRGLASTKDAFLFPIVVQRLEAANIPLTQDRIDRLTHNVARIQEIASATFAWDLEAMDGERHLTEENVDIILTTDPEHADERERLVIEFLQRQVALAPENRGFLREHAEHMWIFGMGIFLLGRYGIVGTRLTREILDFLAAHREQDLDCLCEGIAASHPRGVPLTPRALELLAIHPARAASMGRVIEYLNRIGFLTQKNLDVLAEHAACVGEIRKEIQRTMNQGVYLTQQRFDEIIREIEEKDWGPCALAAEALGHWNGSLHEKEGELCWDEKGNLPEDRSDLRIPSEVISDIALLAHSSKFRADPDSEAAALAEKVERRIIVDLVLDSLTLPNSGGN